MIELNSRSHTASSNSSFAQANGQPLSSSVELAPDLVMKLNEVEELVIQLIRENRVSDLECAVRGKTVLLAELNLDTPTIRRAITDTVISLPEEELIVASYEAKGSAPLAEHLSRLLGFSEASTKSLRSFQELNAFRGHGRSIEYARRISELEGRALPDYTLRNWMTKRIERSFRPEDLPDVVSFSRNVVSDPYAFGLGDHMAAVEEGVQFLTPYETSTLLVTFSSLVNEERISKTVFKKICDDFVTSDPYPLSSEWMNFRNIVARETERTGRIPELAFDSVALAVGNFTIKCAAKRNTTPPREGESQVDDMRFFEKLLHYADLGLPVCNEHTRKIVLGEIAYEIQDKLSVNDICRLIDVQEFFQFSAFEFDAPEVRGVRSDIVKAYNTLLLKNGSRKSGRFAVAFDLTLFEQKGLRAHISGVLGFARMAYYYLNYEMADNYYLDASRYENSVVFNNELFFRERR